MKGWLIVNGFLHSNKYGELYALLQNAAEKRGITLGLKTGDGIFLDVQTDGQLFPLPDFVLFWDKDVTLAKRLETLGVPLFNSARAVEVCDRKTLTALALAQAGVPAPKTILAPKTFEGIGYTRLDFLDSAENALGYPMVLKEDCGSFGKQVYLASNRAEAETIIAGLGHKEFIMQEFIAESSGRDLRVNVVGGRAVSAMLRENSEDFRSNISSGGSGKAYQPSALQAELAVRAATACGLDFAGVDLLFGKDGPLVCEVNSNPHFKSTLDCTGQDLSLEILAYIAEKLDKAKARI